MEITLRHAKNMRDLCDKHYEEKYVESMHNPSERNREVRESALKQLRYWESKVIDLSSTTISPCAGHEFDYLKEDI